MHFKTSISVSVVMACYLQGFGSFPRPRRYVLFNTHNCALKRKHHSSHQNPRVKNNQRSAPEKLCQSSIYTFPVNPRCTSNGKCRRRKNKTRLYVLHYSSEKALKAIGTTSLYYWSGTQNGWTQSYLILTQIALHARPFTRRMHLCNRGDSLVVFCRHKLYVIIKSQNLQAPLPCLLKGPSTAKQQLTFASLIQHLLLYNY